MSKKRKSKQKHGGRKDGPGGITARILDVLSSPDYSPVPFAELERRFGKEFGGRKKVRKPLERLIGDGTVVNLKKKGLALARSADLVAGDISFIRSGGAFVDMLDPKRTVFLPPGCAHTALPGDKVLVRIKRATGTGPGRNLPEGEVIRILERRCRMMVGTLKRSRNVHYVLPMQSRMPRDLIVPDPGGGRQGDRVLVEIEEWDDPKLNPEGRVVDVIGPADEPGLDTVAVIKSYGLPESFPPDALSTARGAALDEKALKNREDLRDLFVFTIDPATARDFDDAISLEKTRGGNWRLGVHIADVSHFVEPGGALDEEAYRRGTSVYFPDAVIPMIPEQLSNGLCSLKEGVDRLAFSAFILLDPKARVKQARFVSSVIRSDKRLTYEQALAIINGKTGGDRRLAEKLRRAHGLAQKLRKRRAAQGALMMEIPEVKLDIGKDGRVAGVSPVDNDVSHQLIEEFMLLANEQVCRKLAKEKIAQLHRVHAEPDEENLAELRKMLQLAGVPAGDLANRMNLSNVLEHIRDMPAGRAWQVSVLRCMKRAEYSVDAGGHYGLAKEYYAHFTSPIRRYPDLVTHRLLKAALAGEESGLSKDELDRIAARSSTRERVAEEAERELKEIKIIRYFSEQIRAGNPATYEAVVVEIRNIGAFVDIPAVGAGGLIHVSDMADDFFDFDPQRRELRGRRTGKKVGIGDRLQVICAKADMESRLIDFVPVE